MTTRRTESTSIGARSLRRRSLLATGAALPVLAVATPAAAQSSVTVDPAAVRQTIQGFGGMNHTVWISDLTAAQRETAFGNGPGQLGFTILRIPVHEDPSRWSGEVATARRAIELGAKVIASPWNPPAWMTETVSGRKRLRYDQYGAYAQHLNDFVAFMRDNGVDLYGISIQNEPDYAHDWTWWTASEIVRFLRDYAGSIQTRVIAPESFQYRKNMSDPILNDPAALANLDILGAHLYGTQPADFPYPLFQQKGGGKELWMTEVYYPNSSDSADLWPQALDVGEHLHRALVHGQFQTYLWWYIRRYYGPMREDGQISKRGANMAHFSKFVRPGYVRIEATANPQSNVYASAYKSGSEIVIVAINKNGWSVSLSFTMRNTTVASVSRWLTDANRNLQAQSDISASGGSFTATLPGQSLTTFVTSATDSGQPVRYEAEDPPAICDGTIDTDHPGYSGTGYCNTPNAIGAYSQFTVTAASTGQATVEIGFANGASGGARGADVVVNGATVASTSFEATGSWTTWSTKTLTVPLNAGDNTIRLVATGSGGLPNIDYLDYFKPSPRAVRYEAEDPPAVCDGTIDTNHAGYSGTGFCNTPNTVGAYAQFTVTAASAGQATVEIGFANGASGGARGADVVVNGTTTGSTTFEGTGSWSTWSTKTLTVPLNAGDNTIRLVATGSGGLPNIDYLDYFS